MMFEEHQLVDDFVTAFLIEGDRHLVINKCFESCDFNALFHVEFQCCLNQNLSNSLSAKLWANPGPSIPGDSFSAISPYAIEQKARRLAVAKRNE